MLIVWPFYKGFFEDTEISLQAFPKQNISKVHPCFNMAFNIHPIYVRDKIKRNILIIAHLYLRSAIWHRFNNKIKTFLSSFTVIFHFSVSIVCCVIRFANAAQIFLYATTEPLSMGKKFAPEIQFISDNVETRIKRIVIIKVVTPRCAICAIYINFSYLSLFKYYTHLQFAYINSFVSISFNKDTCMYFA